MPQSKDFPMPLITLREAAERTGFTTDHLRKRVHAGELTGFRRGKRLILVDSDEIDALTSRL
ncbi:helix-turn-helix transcriptional regulator [Rhodococcus sp. JS3073]|uniref:helix-turn-helix transcriptional regulator n=1 Tax=Rhodococcus sp. JS3073 TaxID=3002901 RepID=UPI0022855AF7|nr:excisionase family DNA-binding protein [Rhodococcus sp. JS3073]WAM13935.1 excisionase family DNA-binding protein [Rhodococcus sp. JS3073]